MEAVVIAGMVATIAGAGYSAYSQHQQGKAANTAAKAAAAESERQAQLENERAGLAQIQGEQEAERRSRQLAADLGATYANYAGNGLLVDGAGKDTLGSVLKTQVAEGQSDISTIRDNTALNVWTHQSNAASLLASAANQRISGRNAAAAGTMSAIGTGISGLGQVASQYSAGAAKFGESGKKSFWNPTGSTSKFYT